MMKTTIKKAFWGVLLLLTAAALTLVTALISPFPRYYLIFGFAMLATSVVIRIWGYK